MEEVLGVDEDEVIGVHEERLPNLVGVMTKLSELGRGDCPQWLVLGDDDMHEADLVDPWIADLPELGREKLLAQQLIERLVESPRCEERLLG